MGRKPPAFKRFFRSPTFITIARPLFAIPLAAALCALFLIGGTHVLGSTTQKTSTSYTADQKLKQAPLPLSKASGSSTTGNTSSSNSTSTSSNAETSDTASHTKKGSDYSNKTTPSTPGTSNQAAVNLNCPSIVKNLTDTYNQELSDAENLLNTRWYIATLNTVLQNQLIDNYNISVTGAYNKIESEAQNDHCTLVLPMPHLKTHQDE